MSVIPKTADAEDAYEIEEEINFFGLTGRAVLELYSSEQSGNGISFIKGETLTGANTGATGYVSKIEENVITVVDISGIFESDESIVGATSGAQRMISTPSHFY